MDINVDKGPDPDDPDRNIFIPPQRVLRTQVFIAVLLGTTALLSFCILRSKWPQFYAARSARRKGLPKVKNGLFSWFKSLYDITEDEILEHAGLDAFVFLGFFKMAITLFSICTFCAVTVIGPIRLHFTGNYDSDDGDDKSRWGRRFENQSEESIINEPTAPEDYKGYLWVYVLFTYVFTGLTAWLLLQMTIKIVRIRQEYLGKQNAITDRTIRLAGIPHDLRSEQALKDHVESLNIGNVRSIQLCRYWKELDELFDERSKVVKKLERAWCEYLGPTWVNEHPGELPTNQSRVSLANSVSDDERVSLLASPPAPPVRSGSITIGSNHKRDFKRPIERNGYLGLLGEKYDVIEVYSQKLEQLDDKIQQIRTEDGFEGTGTAFVTMDSVASAQMTGQAVLDPRPHKLIAETAPAPHDVVWRNLYMTTKERIFRTYSISFFIGLFSVFMIGVVWYLAYFLQYEVIVKYAPRLAELLEKSPWLNTVLRGLLPPWLFSLFTSIVPFIYAWLSSKQGFVSHGEVELSTISKNFFFLFFNMFIVFTVANGAITSYWRFLKDTTQIAYKLAEELRNLSLFYVNLIVLQGIGMMPFRLLQIGGLSRFPFVAVKCKSPRDYRNLYRPPIFNYGITLPQPLVIFIIVVLYSVILTKILFFGLLYFVCGYFTYKYQLMYSMVHPQHSTGRMWQVIFRRIVMGLVLFHLAMAGILALQHAYFLATMLTPLPLIILGYWYNFEENYVPLLKYIALRAIETEGSRSNSSVAVEDEEESNEHTDSREAETVRQAMMRRTSRSQSKTLDEQRERFQKYINPNMDKPLDGPWLGVEGDEVILANSEGTIRKRMRFEEWE